MTPKERQEKTVELRNQFIPISYNFIGKPKEKVYFKFTYMGTDKLLCITPGCHGCTELILEDNIITGHLTLDEKYTPQVGQPSAQISKTITVYFDDGIDWFIIDEKGIRENNPEKIQVTLYLQGQVDLRDEVNTPASQEA